MDDELELELLLSPNASPIYHPEEVLSSELLSIVGLINLWLRVEVEPV
jgi:hypothetical protein